MRHIIVEPYQKFGRLTVLEHVGRHYWRCRCACGAMTVVWKYSLAHGNTKSCGCWRAQVARTHGMSNSPEHVAWRAMIQRCRNPKASEFHRYGGRGRGVCTEWRLSFEKFFADVGPRPSKRHSLERIDNIRGYEPGNVIWASRSQQNRNKRNNRWITFRGERLIIADWAKKLGMNDVTLRRRLAKGWSVERAFIPPD